MLIFMRARCMTCIYATQWVTNVYAGLTRVYLTSFTGKRRIIKNEIINKTNNNKRHRHGNKLYMYLYREAAAGVVHRSRSDTSTGSFALQTVMRSRDKMS